MQKKIQVALSIEVMDIQEITEKDKIFYVPFTLFLSWNDRRLKYANLKNTGLNLLSEEENVIIWKPTVIFQNTPEKQKTKVDPETNIKIKKYGDGTLSDITNPENVKLFDGKDNAIIMQRYYREKFTCK